MGIADLAQAQIYKYVDRDGSVVYTNVPSREVEDQVKAAAKESARSNAVASASPKSGVANQSTMIPNLNANLFDEVILKHAKMHGVDFNLIKAVIKAESNFNHRAVSPKGAKGLMQLMPGTARRYGVRDVFDPDENIGGGVRYLKYLLTMFNHDLKPALAAYNAGENAVLRVKGIPPYRETIDYVKKIIRMYGSDVHALSVRTMVANPLGIYAYKDKDGVLNLSNVDPQQSQ
jgi:soluble lytic murein transglycosylase-like protein